MHNIHFLFFASLLSYVITTNEDYKCKGCRIVLERFRDINQPLLDKYNSDIFNSEKLEEVKEKFFTFCQSFTPGSDEHIFCDSTGIFPTSIASILKDTFQKLHVMPVSKHCETLYQKYPNVCPETKPFDWSVDLKTLTVSKLKDILKTLKGECKGCTDKSEFVEALERLRPKQEL